MNSLELILSRFETDPTGPIPTLVDWKEFEKGVGRSVPEDYMKIVEHTGGESMGCCWLRNPAERNNVNLALSVPALHREHIIWNDIVEEMIGVTWFPEPDGLIQLARVDRIFFMLNTRGDDIVICDTSLWKVHQTKLLFSDLIWSLFKDRNLYDELGLSIWGSDAELFGWR